MIYLQQKMRTINFTTPTIAPSSSQEFAPLHPVPSSSPNVTEQQVQTARVLALELSDPAVNPTLYNQDCIPMRHQEGLVP